MLLADPLFGLAARRRVKSFANCAKERIKPAHVGVERLLGFAYSLSNLELAGYSQSLCCPGMQGQRPNCGFDVL